MEAKTLRNRARAHLAGNWGLSIAVAAVAALLGGVLTGSSFLPEFTYSFGGEARTIREWLSVYTTQIIHLGSTRIQWNPLALVTFLLGGVLQLGYADFLLKQHDGRERNFHDLFAQFDRFGTGFAQQFLVTLYTFLWSLLFVIPGIIKGYSYAMTPFLLAEHPNMTASQAIELSQDMMDGYKMDLFILELTFIGWDILAALTLNLGNIALNPYKNAARAAFYRQLQAEKQYTSYE